MQARLKLENQRLAADHETMLGLLDALNMPFWMRGDRRPAEMGQPRLCRGGRGGRRRTPPCATARNSWARQAREAIDRQHQSQSGLRPDAVDRDRRRPPRLRGDRLRRRRGLGGHRRRQAARSKPSASEYERTVQKPCRHARPAQHGGRDLRRPTRSCASSTRRSRSSGTSTTASWPARRTMRCCSTGCAAKARSPSSRNGGAGRRTCSRAYRVGRSAGASGGICPTAAPSASSPIRSPRAASPGCSRT